MLTSTVPSILIWILVILCIGCKKPAETISDHKSGINTAHLDHLYEEIKVGHDTVGIIHIYAEAPDYRWVGDEDEGIACIDDIARAAIFYFGEYKRTDGHEYFRKARMLMKFVVAMQAENGYYYNFIWPDGTINKEGVTSKAEPSWWSWRAWWALTVAERVLPSDDSLYTVINEQRDRLVQNVLKEPAFRSATIDTAFGIDIPTWLPKGSGTDQASIVLLMLANDYRLRSDSTLADSIRDFTKHLADGILMMQVRAPGKMEDGAFLSWENLWHAYGNIQSYALQTAGSQLDDSILIKAALYEIDHFYPTLLKEGRLDHFWVKKENDIITTYDVKPFNQIAYGQSPIIMSAMQAYRLSLGKEKKYLELAKEAAMWYYGKNPAGVKMYDAATGRCFDGIISSTEVNKNSGAESTIEALLSLQALELSGIYFDETENTFISSDKNN